MATKLEAFLTDKKIDPRRLLAVSRQLERLRPQDRAIKLALRQARKKEDATRPEGLARPRSGRPVTKVTLSNAFAGKRVSGAARRRILRAVNRILELRKNKPAELADLFDE